MYMCLSRGIGVELRYLCLLGKCYSTWAIPPAFFDFRLSFGYSLMFLPGAGLDSNLLAYSLPYNWEHRHIHHAWLISWDGGLANFLPGLASNCNLPDLCLPSSRDYRCELLIPASTYVSFFFFLVGLGFEFRALHLQSRCSIAWAMPPVHFALVILEMGVFQTVYPSWPQALILPISAS
jgi:hypothetical protein